MTIIDKDEETGVVVVPLWLTVILYFGFLNFYKFLTQRPFLLFEAKGFSSKFLLQSFIPFTKNSNY